jgi:hypothetical protein
MVSQRARSTILALSLVVLGIAPFTFRESWKRALAGVAAFLLAIWAVLFWWATHDPRRRIPRVATVLGLIGGLVLGGLGAGLYCQAADCAAGFDALFLLPAGALLGALVGAGIGYAIAHRVATGPTGPRPGGRSDGSRPRSFGDAEAERGASPQRATGHEGP